MSNSSENASRAPEPIIPEVFQLGCIVSFEDNLHERYQGEVIAFDETYKALMLKCQNPDQKTIDVRVVNLMWTRTINIEKEGNPNIPSAPAQVNVEKVKNRAHKHREERQKMANALALGVTREGISLFLAIRKTIEEVTWTGKDILVMNSVKIQHPYKPENCVSIEEHPSSENQSLKHVQNMVSKHIKDSTRSATD